MVGAIQQVMPVVISRQMPTPPLTSWASFLFLIVGALSLSAGFALGKPLLLSIAWPILGLSFVIFIISSLMSLATSPVRNATRTGIFLSILSLGCAVTLGMLLAHGYASGTPLPYGSMVIAHISLSLGGWVLLLIIAMSYQVVPMFQLTPNYNKRISAGLAPSIFSLLLFGMVFLVSDDRPGWLQTTSQLLLWILALSFAFATLWLQNKRRRRIADPTLRLFRLGMVSLIVSGILAISSEFMLPDNHLIMLSAIIFVLGFAMSVMYGMIYKIVPFLIWFHLFRGGVKHAIPNMKEIIPEPQMSWHFWLHAMTAISALFAPWWTCAAWAVSIGIVIQGLLLFYSLLTAVGMYRRTSMQIKEKTQ